MSKTKRFFQKGLFSTVLILVLLVLVLVLAAACSNLAEQTTSEETVSHIIALDGFSEEELTTTTTPPTTTTPTTTTTTPKPTTTSAPTTTPIKTTATTAAVGQTTTTPAPTTTAPYIQPKIDQYHVGTLKITASAANVRSAASSKAGVLGVAGNGTKLELLGQTTDEDGNKWYAVKYKNQTGFVGADLVEFISDVGTAYLTFDDGPSKVTNNVLNILDEYGIKGTFFVKYNKGVDSLYKQIVDRGHTIANHTYSHDYASVYSSDEAFHTELERMENFILSTTGTSTKIMRFPGGSSNTVSKKYNKGIITRLSKSVVEQGYVYFDWNVDSGDANGTTVAKNTIINNVKNGVGVKSQVIILMHDSSSKTTTAEALPEIIKYLRNRGYTIKALTHDTPPIHHSIQN